MVPRWLTEVVETRMPSWVTAWPARVMSPCWASTRPVLVTVPLLLPLRSSGAISLPRVVEFWLALVP